MTVTSPPLQIEGKPGYLFASTCGAGACFVPAECVEFHQDGGARIDHAKYVIGGWAKKNAIFNPRVPTHRLFASPRHPLSETESADAAEFIHRLLEARCNAA